EDAHAVVGGRSHQANGTLGSFCSHAAIMACQAYPLQRLGVRVVGLWEEHLMNIPSFSDIEAAAPVGHRYLKPTPLYEWPALSRLLGFRYFLKHENHTPTTAFKVRGGIYLVSRLSHEQKRRGIIGCTTGNHGQSLAYACRLFGVRCTLVVPER